MSRTSQSKQNRESKAPSSTGNRRLSEALYDLLRASDEPTALEVRMVFGTFNEALSAAGLPQHGQDARCKGMGATQFVRLLKTDVAPWLVSRGLWAPGERFVQRLYEAYHAEHLRSPSVHYAKRMGLTWGEIVALAGFVGGKSVPFNLPKATDELDVLVAELGYAPGPRGWRRAKVGDPRRLAWYADTTISAAYRRGGWDAFLSDAGYPRTPAEKEA